MSSVIAIVEANADMTEASNVMQLRRQQRAAKLERVTLLARRYLAAVCIQRKFRCHRLMLRAKRNLHSLRLLQVIDKTGRAV